MRQDQQALAHETVLSVVGACLSTVTGLPELSTTVPTTRPTDEIIAPADILDNLNTTDYLVRQPQTAQKLQNDATDEGEGGGRVFADEKGEGAEWTHEATVNTQHEPEEPTKVELTMDEDGVPAVGSPWLEVDTKGAGPDYVGADQNEDFAESSESAHEQGLEAFTSDFNLGSTSSASERADHEGIVYSRSAGLETAPMEVSTLVTEYCGAGPVFETAMAAAAATKREPEDEVTRSVDADGLHYQMGMSAAAASLDAPCEGEDIGLAMPAVDEGGDGLVDSFVITPDTILDGDSNQEVSIVIDSRSTGVVDESIGVEIATVVAEVAEAAMVATVEVSSC